MKPQDIADFLINEKQVDYPNLISSCHQPSETFEGTTLLHVAVEFDNTECIQALIKNGAKINMLEPRSGFSALHLAIENEVISHTEKTHDSNSPNMIISKLLLDLGASPNTKNSEGLSCIEYAEQRGHQNAYNFMNSNNQPQGR